MKQYTASEVLDELQAFNAKYPEAAYSYAHIVLDDQNLDDSSIKHCQQSPLYDSWLKDRIRGLPKDLPDKIYIDSVKHLLETREKIVEVLVWLTGIPEEVREQAMDLAHGETELTD